MATRRAEEFRRNAEEAERRAERAGSPDERESFLKVARGWRELLAAEEQRIRRGI